uniref:Tesmin/TSO1-like CXC domain-containing protein n=1 Tax=Amphimedon queenslandica TaxID=400682 RepID=A0A1X7T3B7_AMPQE
MSKATKDFEACLLPTYTALARHALRTSYVLKLVFSITSINCPVLNECDSFGWIVQNQNGCITVNVDWDDIDTHKSFVSSHVTCSCKSGCGTKRCKCFNANQNCHVRCKCKQCTNRTRFTTEPSETQTDIDTCSTNEVLVPNAMVDTDYDTDTDSDLDIQMYVDNCIDDIADACL